MKMTSLFLVAATLVGCGTDSSSSSGAKDTVAASDTPSGADAVTSTDPGPAPQDTATEGDAAAPPGCWMPDAPATGVAIECPALCKQIQTCLPDDTGCAEGCSAFSHYVTAAASAVVSDCIMKEPCGYKETGELLAKCIQDGVAAGSMTRAPAAKAACDAVAATAAKCGLDAEKVAAGACELFIPIFVPAATDQIAACAEVACPDLAACVSKANCLFN